MQQKKCPPLLDLVPRCQVSGFQSPRRTDPTKILLQCTKGSSPSALLTYHAPPVSPTLQMTHS